MFILERMFIFWRMFILEDARWTRETREWRTRVSSCHSIVLFLSLSLSSSLIHCLLETRMKYESSSFSPLSPGKREHPIFQMLLTFRRAVTSYLRAVTIVAHSFPFPLFASLHSFLPSRSLPHPRSLFPSHSFSAISHSPSPSVSLLFARTHT